MTKTAQARFITVLTAIFLTINYLICGFGVCAGIPFTTDRLANITSNADASPFQKPELVSLAVDTRDFVAGSISEDELFDEIAKANNEASTPYAGASNEELKAADDRYTLDADSISHLYDVQSLFSKLITPMLGFTVLAAFCLMVTLYMFGAKWVGRELLAGGIAALSCFAVLAIWGAVSFDSLFSWMHSLFFADGTWTFPADSLLICMYPENFWIGMGVVWLITSCTLSVLSVAIGALMCLRMRIKDGKETKAREQK